MRERMAKRLGCPEAHESTAERKGGSRPAGWAIGFNVLGLGERESLQDPVASGIAPALLLHPATLGRVGDSGEGMWPSGSLEQEELCFAGRHSLLVAWEGPDRRRCSSHDGIATPACHGDRRSTAEAFLLWDECSSLTSFCFFPREFLPL